MIIAEISNGRVITLIKMMNCLKNIYIYIYIKVLLGKIIVDIFIVVLKIIDSNINKQGIILARL